MDTKSLGNLTSFDDSSGLKLNMKSSVEEIHETPNTYVASLRPSLDAPSLTASNASPSMSSVKFDLNLQRVNPPSHCLEDSIGQLDQLIRGIGSPRSIVSVEVGKDPVIDLRREMRMNFLGVLTKYRCNDG